MIKSLTDEFTEPSGSYRGKPFWAWNGRLKAEELLRQIDIMKEMGFGGYFMHSRVGLETEYLGEEWFDMIKRCADRGSEKGMESDLYDEDRWPSGTAGGMVTRLPEDRMKFIEMTISERYAPAENEIITFACMLTDDGYESCRVLDKDGKLSPGESVVCFSIVTMSESNFYNGSTYADTMKRGTTDKFIASTHELYKTHCGGRLGGSIKEIFTDEPNRGALFSGFSGGAVNRAPYTDGLFAEFKRRYGYDLKERLAELFLVRDIRQVKWHYCELIQSLFLENYFAPIYKWCEENNMRLTGHVIEENSLCAQTAMQGSVMRSYEYMHTPGMDSLTEGNRCYWAAKQVASVARQLGKSKCLSELYGATGWQMDFMSHKTVGDWQALFGINERCHHLSWYTMKGEAKRDYPASILHQSAWYKDYKYIEDYFERLHFALSTGETEQELIVIYPIESVTARVYSGCFSRLSAADSAMKEIEEIFQRVFKELTEARIDFDYADEAILAKYGNADGAALRVGKAVYKRVLVAGMDTMRRTTLDILDEFAQNGGEVIACGRLPGHIDAMPDNGFARIKHRHVETDTLAGAAACGNEVTGGSRKIFVQTRKYGGSRIVVLLNSDRENPVMRQHLRLGTGNGVFELDCRSGKKIAVNHTVSDGYVYVTTDFCPGEEKVYVVTADAQAQPEKVNRSCEETVPGPYDYELTAPNICVLDKVRYSIDGSPMSGETEILAADRRIRECFGIPYRGGDMLQPWYAKQQGLTGKQLGKVRLLYEFEIEVMPEKDIELVGEYPPEAAVEINDMPFDAVSAGKWIDICFDRYRIPYDMLKLGVNTVSVTLDFSEETDLEAMYLLGSFGVDASNGGRVLTRLPEKLGIGDITEFGLPFYSDSIIYKMCAEHSGMLTLGSLGGAYAKYGDAIMGFLPYKCEVEKGDFEIELVLTRRNTFGPLHQNEENITVCEPSSFVTTGDKFTEDYRLIRQGILEPPVIRYSYTK